MSDKLAKANICEKYTLKDSFNEPNLTESNALNKLFLFSVLKKCAVTYPIE